MTKHRLLRATDLVSLRAFLVQTRPQGKNRGGLTSASYPRAETAPNIAVEPTPNSLRSYVASALGRSSPRAFGSARRA